MAPPLAAAAGGKTCRNRNRHRFETAGMHLLDLSFTGGGATHEMGATAQSRKHIQEHW
jgi:hypothetical protein